MKPWPYQDSDDDFEKEVWVDVSSMSVIFWHMTLTDSGHGKQLHQPDGQGHRMLGQAFLFSFGFFSEKLEEWKKMRSSSCTL